MLSPVIKATGDTGDRQTIQKPLVSGVAGAENQRRHSQDSDFIVLSPMSPLSPAKTSVSDCAREAEINWPKSAELLNDVL